MGMSVDAVPATGPIQTRAPALERPCVRGKFLFVGTEKFYVKGVTYGAFHPREDKTEYCDPAVIDRDFAQMAANGINTVRIPHTVPPRSLLDAACRHGLRVMVGLSAEQYVGYLIDSKKDAPDIERLVRDMVRDCAKHPALLCYVLGNEIPSSLVRFIGHRRIERYLRQLYRVVKSEDPDAVVTYANYPTTEYLRLPWLDIVCFNVYLESQEALAAYIARLQNLSEDRPLIMGELGLDSIRNGEEAQARSLGWQIQTAFAGGCAGAVVFAWTDEWFRAGADVHDWGFGITDRKRRPKPALDVVREAFARSPFPAETVWPRISVVVCTYNGSRTIRECLDGLRMLDYPASEVIVVDDGSTDDTAIIAREFGFRVITTEHAGLSAARNTGLEAATGEIVAYIDDDAYPDPQWLKYIALAFLNTTCAGVGGPNIEPPYDGAVADSVANSPGGPIHVLLTDTEAEHLPGCNMAFRRAALEAIGGFDSRFSSAGDDVDVCWQLQAIGSKLVFSPAAVVWHHARKTVAAYWKQQRGYGKAEALLEAKWPDKFNHAGNPTWSGRVYGKGADQTLNLAPRIFWGIRGRAPFQFLYEPSQGTLGPLLMSPDWYLTMGWLVIVSIGAILWRPLLLALPLLMVMLALLLMHASLSAVRASFPLPPFERIRILKRRFITAFLHILQPLARVCGRIAFPPHPPRIPGFRGFAFFLPRAYSALCTSWEAGERILRDVEEEFREKCSFVLVGGSYAPWDIEIRGGVFGGIRLLMAIEDLGPERQLVRVRSWPTFPGQAVALMCFPSALAVGAAFDRAWLACALLGITSFVVAFRACKEAGVVAAVVQGVLTRHSLTP
jgi:GT2 family glycosyltransferase